MLKLIEDTNKEDNYEIRRERSYYAVYKNGKFLCNVDDEREGEEEIENDKKKSQKQKPIKEYLADDETFTPELEGDEPNKESKEESTEIENNEGQVEFKDLEPSEQDKLTKNAFYENVSLIIQNTWNLISSINSLLTNLDFDYKKDNSEDIKSVLNEVIDDLSIDVGMLNKVNSLFDEDKDHLISKGELKAEEILKNKESSI